MSVTNSKLLFPPSRNEFLKNLKYKTTSVLFNVENTGEKTELGVKQKNENFKFY
jgi:hypothetical protein